MKLLIPKGYWQGLVALALAGLLLLAAFTYPASVPLETPAGVPLSARPVGINTGVITADTNFTGVEWPGGAAEADLFYSIDQGTVNTTSLELEVSADGTTWYDDPVSPTLLSANVADASGIIYNIPVHGWQFRLVANTSNTNTITPLLTVVIR